jgi:FKBP-type peptidyl-prolyl cis-trans isomerase
LLDIRNQSLQLFLRKFTMSAQLRFLSSVILVLSLVVLGCGSEEPGPGPADSDAPTEFTETPTGLKYRILRKSDGKKPTASSLVKVHYKGWLDDGTEFDNSYKKKKGPFVTPVNKVIVGWTEGLQLVGQGGMIELEIPPHLGYGDRPYGRIPAGSTLHFIVELEAVRDSI